MDEKIAYAHDPVSNEDVQIRCSNKHQQTGFDYINGDELPVLIESDFRHDPVEGCQGSYREITEIDGGCPNCGYDRADAAVHTHAGVHRMTCRACGCDITDRHRDDWEPTEPTDDVARIKQGSEYVGQTSYLEHKVYQRNDDSYALLAHGSSTSVHTKDLLDMVYMVISRMDEGDLDRRTGTNLIMAITSAIDTKEDDNNE